MQKTSGDWWLEEWMESEMKYEFDDDEKWTVKSTHDGNVEQMSS